MYITAVTYKLLGSKILLYLSYECNKYITLTYRQGDNFVEQHNRSHMEIENKVLKGKYEMKY